MSLILCQFHETLTNNVHTAPSTDQARSAGPHVTQEDANWISPADKAYMTCSRLTSCTKQSESSKNSISLTHQCYFPPLASKHHLFHKLPCMACLMTCSPPPPPPPPPTPPPLRLHSSSSSSEFASFLRLSLTHTHTRIGTKTSKNTLRVLSIQINQKFAYLLKKYRYFYLPPSSL